jgi:uncharacterized protein (DUF2126 family)
MDLAESLLVRPLLSASWKTLYKDGVVHRGTALHDRFLRPASERNDLPDELANAAEAENPDDKGGVTPTL